MTQYTVELLIGALISFIIYLSTLQYPPTFTSKLIRHTAIYCAFLKILKEDLTFVSFEEAQINS